MLRSPFNQVCKRQISEATVDKTLSIWGKTIAGCIFFGSAIGFWAGAEEVLEDNKPSSPFSKKQIAAYAIANGISQGCLYAGLGMLVGFFPPVTIPGTTYVACKLYTDEEKTKNVK